MIEGDVVYVDYGEQPPVVHCRLLGAQVHQDLWVIITPDLDVYEELLSSANSDCVAFHGGQGGLNSPIPAHLNAANVYGFRPMTANEYQRVMNEARVYAAQLRAQMGLPPPGLPPPPPVGAQGAAAVGAQSDPLVWIAVENDHGKIAGEVLCAEGVPLPPGSVTLGGNKALIPFGSGALCVKQVAKSKVGTMETRDLRVLPLCFDEQQQRRVDFARAVSKMTQDPMPGGGMQLDGPPSALGVLKSMVARGLTPVTDHEHWLRTHDIPKGDRSQYEMEVITRVLEALIMNDQVNIPNLRGAELLIRRWQLIREAHRLSPGSPDYSASDVFMGWEYRRGDGVSPDLARHVAAELKDQAQIAKESRKAREEMSSRRRGGGRGNAAASEQK